MVTGYGKESSGERYGRDLLAHNKIEALDLKAVTEEIKAEQMRHGIFRFENFDDASGYVAREMETTGSPIVLSYLKHA
jgi:hypothetical protein